MIKKHKPHDSHKYKECDSRQKYPFYQAWKVGLFVHLKNLSEIKKSTKGNSVINLANVNI